MGFEDALCGLHETDIPVQVEDVTLIVINKNQIAVCNLCMLICHPNNAPGFTLTFMTCHKMYQINRLLEFWG